MRAQPVKLDQPQKSKAKKLLFIEDARAILSTSDSYNKVEHRHGFIVNDFLILPGDACDRPKTDFTPLRELLDEFQPNEAESLAIGASLLNWDFVTQKCGVCGSLLNFKTNELGKQCSSCSQTFYPQIQPVAIVLVRRGPELLLARGLAPRKHHSCLAGFVEVGETVESTAHREVKEEVGVEISNLKYFSSQSWPFPSNLMLGYIADYKSGDIKIDTSELSHAAWFTKENPPEVLPPKISIARRMIDSVWTS